MKWVLLETVGMVRRLPAVSFISSFIQNNRQWHTAVCDTQCGVHLHVTRGDWVGSGEEFRLKTCRGEGKISKLTGRAGLACYADDRQS